jgi:hypothetical protein
MKLRPTIQTFLMAKTVRGYHCIEHQTGPRSWRLLGDKNGVFKFETPEARDAKIRELMAEEEAPNETELSDDDEQAEP